MTAHPQFRAWGLVSATVLGLIVVMAGWGWPARSGAEDWTPTRMASPKGQAIGWPNVAVGPRGYTVIAWTVARTVADSENPYPPPYGRGRVRVKFPGAKRFGSARSFGGTGARDIQVGIGKGGQTVLTWAEANGRQRVAYRNLSRGWSRPQTIRGPKMPGEGILSVGPDGTAAIMGSNLIADSPARPRILVSVRRPGKRFGRWVQVSRSPASIGLYSDVVAGTRGRATVVWSGPCPLGPPENTKPARWVDLVGSRSTTPAVVPHSRCMPFPLALERDDRGFEYLRVGGPHISWIGVKLSVRPPGQPFPPAEYASRFGQLTDGGQMSVSPSGYMTLAWGAYDGHSDRIAYETVSSRHGSPLTPIESMAGIRHPDDAFIDLATLPDGSTSTLWLDIRTFRIGRGLLVSGQTFPGPAYFSPPLIHESLTEMGVEAARDGHQFTWWTESGYDEKITDFRWTETRYPAATWLKLRLNYVNRKLRQTTKRLKRARVRYRKLKRRSAVRKATVKRSYRQVRRLKRRVVNQRRQKRKLTRKIRSLP